MCVALKDRALVRMSGADAETLLQDVISCDVVDLQAGHARSGALLTPQGKILFEFLISRSGEDGFLLDLSGEISSGFIQRMTLYKLRAKVTIEAVDEQPVHACWAGERPEEALFDERFPDGVDVYRLYGASPSESGTLSDYDRIRIESGVAEAGRDYELSDAFPHDVLMDLNNGISRGKGVLCRPGGGFAHAAPWYGAAAGGPGHLGSTASRERHFDRSRRPPHGPARHGG